MLLWLTLACGEQEEAETAPVDSWVAAPSGEVWADAPTEGMQRTSKVFVTEEFRCWRWEDATGPGVSVGELRDGQLIWVDSFHGELGEGEASKPLRAYQRAWSEWDRRAEHLQSAWSEGGRWVDPVEDVAGQEALEHHIERTMNGVMTRRFTFAERGGVDIVDDRFRFHWDMQWKKSGDSVLLGWDYGRLDASGRIELLVGCWER
jgi:hypothetical protein